MERFTHKILVFSLVVLLTTITVKPQAARRLFILKKFAEPLYRKPTKAELSALSPDRDLLERHTNFLNQPDTGITKLIVDRGCSENTNVVSADQNCLKHSFPGGGSSFSFRIENYRIPRLADITYTRDSFQATGSLLHGVFVNIGDVPLERVSLETKGLEFVSRFPPPKDYKSAKRADKILSRGFVYKGLIHRRALYIKENTTFVLRSIAYRGKLYRSVAGITYNELSFDRRRDMTVAFRIVRKDSSGNLTILWKILSKRKAPKLKRTKR